MYNPNYIRTSPIRNDRFAGGFAVPFILGGITGGLLANSRYNYPIMYTPYPYYPYPYYYRTSTASYPSRRRQHPR